MNSTAVQPNLPSGQRLALLGLALALLFAGCASPVPAEAGPSHGHMPEAAHLHTLYLHHNGTLSGTESGTGIHPLAWSYGDWIAGTPPPTWVSEPASHAMLATQVTVTVTYRASLPVVSSQVRPQFTAWLGVTDPNGPPAIVDHMFAPGPDTMLPGDSQTVTFPVGLPAGGLVRQIGQGFILQVASYYPDSPASTMAIVLENTRVDWSGAPAATPALGTSTATSVSGELAGGRCVADANPNGDAMAVHDFEVNETVGAISVILARTLGAGAGPDLDMFLTDANGTTIAYAAGSASPEAIYIHAANLHAAAPGQWRLTVYNCQPQVSQFQATLSLAPLA